MKTEQYGTKELMRRFMPYFKKYKGTLFLDLFCASMTTVCELVLPLIMRYITNEGLRDLAALSIKTIAGLGFIYFLLRVIDCFASYYMAGMGHVMGAKIETDMRRDAIIICRSFPILIITIQKWDGLWAVLQTTCLMLLSLPTIVRRNFSLRGLRR